MDFNRLADAVIEGPVVTSFTRIGYDLRSRLDDWRPIDGYDLAGRRIVVTGGTSGLGNAIAAMLAGAGATVTITGRSLDRTREAAQELGAEIGCDIDAAAADMGEFDEVRALAETLMANGGVDVLIHNAGALTDQRNETSAGHEATVASQVYGPFLLTSLMLDELASGDTPGRVLTMSSGGMYAANLAVGGLELDADAYNGTKQYALAKRAQVTLNELWAEHESDRNVVFHAVHPGWADTPGVADALPGFGKLLGPLLRSPEQGGDTMAWLAADDAAIETSGRFWLDRRPRSIHKTIFSKLSDTPERRARLWSHVSEVIDND